jgi:hypothetical protein
VSEDERIRGVLQAHGIPAPEGLLTKARFVNSQHGDWYVRVGDDKWFWFDARTGGGWKYCPLEVP